MAIANPQRRWYFSPLMVALQNRRRGWALACLVALTVAVPVAAEPAATAAELATQAGVQLERAEAATGDATKLAAYEKGRDLARRAIEIDENNADAHFVLFATEGRIALMSGMIPNPLNLRKAQGRLDRVLELDPNHSHGLAARGGLYRKLPWALGGSLEKAETFLKRSIEHNPQAIGARIELAATYRDMGKSAEQCRPLLDQAIAIAEQQGKRHRIEQANQLLAELSH